MTDTLHTVYISLGSNLGDRSARLGQAIALLREQAGEVVQVSPFYQTAAWGNTGQPDFLNAVAGLKTLLDAEVLMQRLLTIEQEMGRVRAEKWGPRTIDLDILLYDDLVLESPTLIVPHPQLHLRRFVLEPLSAIAAQAIHPVFRQTIRALLASCPDRLAVAPISPNA